MNASEMMTKKVFTVGPELEVHKLAEFFVEKNVSGAPVVSKDGKVLGVVLEDDLIVRDRRVHLPTFIFLLSGVIALGEKKLESEMKKIAASTVEDIMRKDPQVVSPEAQIEEIAGLIIDKGASYLLVMDKGALSGVITKKDIVKAISENKIY